MGVMRFRLAIIAALGGGLDVGAALSARASRYNFVMARDLTELFREASELPEAERAELAGRLLQTLHGEPDDDVEAAWAEEIERRVREIDSGKVKTIPWSEVRAKLYARLREKS